MTAGEMTVTTNYEAGDYAMQRSVLLFWFSDSDQTDDSATLFCDVAAVLATIIVENRFNVCRLGEVGRPEIRHISRNKEMNFTFAPSS